MQSKRTEWIKSIYVKHLLLKSPFIKIHEKICIECILCKFSCICNFAIFVHIFMKFTSKCRTNKLVMINTISGSFCSFLNWEGADIWPLIRPRKIPVGKMFLYMHAQLSSGDKDKILA